MYSPSDDVHSIGLRAEWIDTPAPYAEGRNEWYVMYREDTSSCRSTENVESSPSQLWGVEREICSLTAQQEPWPIPPPLLQGDFPARGKEDEYDDGLPPPPWPSNEPASMPPEGEERQMVTIIDRMMNQLQQLKVVCLQPRRDHPLGRLTIHQLSGRNVTHHSQSVLLAWTGLNLGLRSNTYQGRT